MSTTFKIICVCVVSTIIFALGRYSAPEKIKTEIQTVYVEKKTEKTSEHAHKETVVVEKPDGSKETKTVEDDHKTTNEQDTVASDTKNTTETIRGVSKVTVSALAGIKPFGGTAPVYGAAISKPILGPITTGLWGMSDGTFGASIGLTF